jgi:hypothetical protein
LGLYIYNISGVKAVMASSLFVVGEIGGVDYIVGLTKKKSMEEMRLWVPNVVDAIISAINVKFNFSVFSFSVYLLIA